MPLALDGHLLLLSPWAARKVSPGPASPLSDCASPGPMSSLALVLGSFTPQLRCFLANEVGSVLLLLNSVSLSLEDLPRRQKLLTLHQIKYRGQQSATQQKCPREVEVCQVRGRVPTTLSVPPPATSLATNASQLSHRPSMPASPCPKLRRRSGHIVEETSTCSEVSPSCVFISSAD